MAQWQNKKLGQLLCEKTYLNEAQLDHALNEQSADPRCLGQILLDLGYITAEQLTEALSLQAGIETVDLAQVSPEANILSLVPAELVSKYNMLPLWRRDNQLALALADPFDAQALQEVRTLSGFTIRRYYASPNELERAILKLYGSNVARMLENLAPSEQSEGQEFDNGDYSPAKLHELARRPSLVNLVNLIVLEAVEARASDVHIEPFEHQLNIKYRIDGMLVEKAPSPKRLQAAIISRIKIMADMNIAERFVPQDGHIEFAAHHGKVDIRVSTVPTVFGESVTLRILDRSASLLSLEDLGMDQHCLGGFDHSLARPHGIILVTGPTGSGKTTTLYAALNKIYTPRQKIITIEDPVEYQLNGVIQMPVNPKRGLTFATGLRHILRQDPDIIMVGEIRDRETADIAIRAALTGHLVFSTLHTNDAPGAITRLLDMGVEPFLLASSLEAVLAQRLVRKICPVCQESYLPDANLLKSLNGPAAVEADFRLVRGIGCDECMQTGMRGRTGIFELLTINDPLRRVISDRPTIDQITKAASADHVCMRRDGISKIIAGITTPEEVMRVTQAIDND